MSTITFRGPLGGTAEYEEIDGSPRGVMDENGFRATREFKVPWASVDKFMRDVMGFVQEDSSATPIVYAPYPLPGGWENCLPVSASFKPFQGKDQSTAAGTDLVTNSATSFASYTNGALVTIEYASQYCFNQGDVHTNLSSGNLPIPDGTRLIYESEFSGEMMTVPAGKLYWGSVAAANIIKEDVHPGLVIPTIQHTLTWLWIAKPPWSVIQGMIGKVNSATFLGTGNIGNVLFLGCQPTAVFRTQKDTVLYRLQYRFAEQVKQLADGTTKKGWNYFWKEQATGGGENWIEVLDAQGVALYKSGSFATLFQYGT